ncbi:BTAD domain-containing putative transcriptional regulator [Streptomyces europaeiscabiei]|uniref:AfsR/SARP family transcriptional regulator n=1 Tax=Streptomyces europaeiscabiei TaxID=146819 RepID=UPI0029A6C17A|nr:BTAD domain-containing putative transcriptional regulator [Streptomyces europaeiscabiei]MDX3696397.1 BTAD domain-containing putative transcriptional regulator [Streptomyces europaeiscabiei]
MAHEDEVDVLLFERQVSAALQVIRQRSGRGPVTDAVASGRRALGLFAAGPLLDVAGEGAQTMARQLSERRLHVLEECLEAQLDLGQAADVIGELARLVVEHPLRGRLQVLHMKALQQLGRRADALNAYQAARRAYGKHLGVEPDPELRSLYEAILRDLRYPAATAGGDADPVPYARTPRRGQPGTQHAALRRPTLGQYLLE